MRRMMRRPFTPLLLLPLLLPACTLPPYDQDISLAALTAGRMEQVAVVGPFQLWRGNYDGRELSFLPAKEDLLAGADPRGYLVAASDYAVDLAAVEVSGGSYTLSGSYGAQMDNSDPTRFSYTAETVKRTLDPTAFNLQVVVFDPTSGERTYLQFNQYFDTTATGTPIDLKTPLSGLGLVSPKAIGVRIAPAADPTYDTLQVLCRDSSGNLAEAAFQTSTTTGLVTPGTAVRTGFTLPQIPASVASGFYSRDVAAGVSFFSFYDQADGKWKTYSWDSGATAATELPVHRRVNAVLSTGELFSRDGAAAYLYDAAGKQLNRIPLGGLRFLYELYSGGKYYSYFSLPVWAEVRGGNGWELRVVVYRLPTSDLAGL